MSQEMRYQLDEFSEHDPRAKDTHHRHEQFRRVDRYPMKEQKQDAVVHACGRLERPDVDDVQTPRDMLA